MPLSFNILTYFNVSNVFLAKRGRLFAITMCAAALLGTAACSQSDSTATSEAADSAQPTETQSEYQSTSDVQLDYPSDWTIEVSGAEKTSLTLDDLDGLTEGAFSQARDVGTLDSDIVEYRGYMIGDVLNYLGVTDYSSVTITGQDGNSRTLEKEAIDELQAYYLALEMDNTLLDSEMGPVMLVEPGVNAADSIKNIQKIEINA